MPREEAWEVREYVLLVWVESERLLCLWVQTIQPWRGRMKKKGTRGGELEL